MKTLGAVAGSVLFASGLWAQGGAMQAGDLLPRGLQPEGSGSRLVVNVVTEMTDAGRGLPAASADAPIAYLAHDGGKVELGEVMGGERPPVFTVLAGSLQHALGRSGYVAATAGQRPGVLIFYRWGIFNREPRGFPELERINLVERAALVGGTQFGYDVASAIDGGMLNLFSRKDPRTQLLMDQVQSDLYFLIASAYDYSAAEQGRVQLLWRTKLSTQSRGVTMEEALPAAVADAAPHFGHDTGGSVRIDARINVGNVEVGQPTVKEYLDAPLPANFKPDNGDLKPIPADRIPAFPLAR